MVVKMIGGRRPSVLLAPVALAPVALALSAALLAAWPAQAMPVDEFLNRANTLKAKGMMAMFQKSEINALMGEVKGAMDAYKGDLDRKQPGSESSLGCPPAPGTKTKMSSDEILSSFATIPKDQQARTSVKTAFYDFMRKRFPCQK